MDRSSEEVGGGAFAAATAAVSSCRAELDGPMSGEGRGGGQRLCRCCGFRRCEKSRSAKRASRSRTREGGGTRWTGDERVDVWSEMGGSVRTCLAV